MSQFSTFEKCRPAPKESGIGVGRGWPMVRIMRLVVTGTS